MSASVTVTRGPWASGFVLTEGNTEITARGGGHRAPETRGGTGTPGTPHSLEHSTAQPRLSLPPRRREPPHRTWASRAPTVWATPSRSVQARDPRPPAPGSAHTAPAGTAPQAPAQGPRRLLSAPGTRGSSEPPQHPSQHHLCVCSPPGRELSRAGPRLGGPPSEAHSLRNGGHMNGGCGTATLRSPNLPGRPEPGACPGDAPRGVPASRKESGRQPGRLCVRPRHPRCLRPAACGGGERRCRGGR